MNEVWISDAYGKINLGLHVLGNIAAHQVHFAVAYPPVRFVQRGLAGAQALHLAPAQHDSALERVENVVLVLGAAVHGDDLFPGLLAFLLAGFGRLSRGRVS